MYMLSGKTLDDLYNEIADCKEGSIKHFVITKTIANRLKPIPKPTITNKSIMVDKPIPVVNNPIETPLEMEADLLELIDDANKSLLNLLDENELDELSMDSFKSELSEKSFMKDQKFAKAIEKDKMNNFLSARLNSERDIRSNKVKPKLESPYSDRGAGNYAKANL